MESAGSHSDNSAYQHEPLTDLRSIRILRLHPDRGDGTLQVDLVPVLLDESIGYEAISYAWGDTSCISIIKCGTKSMQIPESAYKALMYLRKDPSHGLLWIDAICINQRNLAERNQQVQLMGDIYSKARCVLVWLGTPDVDSDLVFAHFDARTAKPPGTGDVKFEDTALDRNFREFMDRPYFRRIWPIQEVALSTKCIVTCGGHAITFTSFMDQIVAMQQALTLTLCPPRQLRLHRRLAAKRTQPSVDQEEAGDISRTLLDARYHESTEPRDKIFALYALLRDMGLHLATPDYAIPVALLYRETTIAVIQHDKSLSMLYGLTGTTQLSNCPSWVPDWSKSTPISEFIIWEEAWASGPPIPAYYMLSEDRTALTLYGHGLDRIEQIFAAFPAFSVLDTVEAQAQESQTLADWFLALDTTAIDLSFFMQSICARSKSFRSSWFGSYQSSDEEDGLVAAWVLEMRECFKSNEDVESYLQQLRLKESGSPLRILHAVLRRRLDRKVLFRTQQGLYGIVSQHAEVGDSIALFSSCRLPMVFRPCGTDWKLVAPTYVYGAMNGEQWRGDVELQSFTFV